MTIDHTVNDILNAGGKALSFAGTPPILHRGTVISATTSQQTTPDGKPKTYDNGDPMMQIVVTLQTDYRDNGPTDDGIRRLFIKGHAIQALRTALAGNKLEAGGELALQYASDKPSTTAGYNPTKQYVAQYRPPTPTAAANDLLGATPMPAALPSSFPDVPPAAQKVDPFGAGTGFLDS